MSELSIPKNKLKKAGDNFDRSSFLFNILSRHLSKQPTNKETHPYQIFLELLLTNMMEKTLYRDTSADATAGFPTESSHHTSINPNFELSKLFSVQTLE